MPQDRPAPPPEPGGAPPPPVPATFARRGPRPGTPPHGPPAPPPRPRPTRLYRTPEDLADGIRRYLRGEALEAGPESAAYRARKFVRRHRAPVAAGTPGAAL